VLAAISVGSGFRDAFMGAIFILTAFDAGILIIVYGFAASSFPCGCLLAPRDYLSTFVTWHNFSVGSRHRGATDRPCTCRRLTRFADGTAGVCRNHFPLAFITIACGAVSGFHSLISSGTTPS